MPASAWSGSRTPASTCRPTARSRPASSSRRKLTATTELKEKAAALWKMDDFGDALYVFGIGLAASITAAHAAEGRVPRYLQGAAAGADVKKNDIAVLVSFVYKFD